MSQNLRMYARAARKHGQLRQQHRTGTTHRMLIKLARLESKARRAQQPGIKSQNLKKCGGKPIHGASGRAGGGSRTAGSCARSCCPGHSQIGQTGSTSYVLVGEPIRGKPISQKTPLLRPRHKTTSPLPQHRKARDILYASPRVPALNVYFYM